MVKSSNLMNFCAWFHTHPPGKIRIYLPNYVAAEDHAQSRYSNLHGMPSTVHAVCHHIHPIQNTCS